MCNGSISPASFQRSSVVEREAVNFDVVGPIPTAGAMPLSSKGKDSRPSIC
jgi:hypothetical protein